MSTYPRFWSQPLRYMRWAAHDKPAIFYSIVLGAMGPVIVLVGTPLRRRYLYPDAPLAPQTYPIPPGPRQIPEGFDDPQ